MVEPGATAPAGVVGLPRHAVQGNGVITGYVGADLGETEDEIAIKRFPVERPQPMAEGRTANVTV